MKVLLVKMSSLGDVLHTLPALNDAYRSCNIEVTWVIEPSFQAIPFWHPAVKRVIPFPLRSMRRKVLSSIYQGQITKTLNDLRKESYDLIIDAQGLLKSALVTRFAKGPVVGLDAQSCREPMASWFYRKGYAVPKGQHAVIRLRQLFAQIFGHSEEAFPFDYGIDLNGFKVPTVPQKSILLLHGTTWQTKHWPEQHWLALSRLLTEQGYQVLLTWGNEEEKARAEQIKAGTSTQGLAPQILDKMDLNALASVMKQLAGVVAVDTGLGHLAAALSVPCVSVYGPTDPKLTGAYGLNQKHLQSGLECAPCLQKKCTYSGASILKPACFVDLTPERVWEHLRALINQG